MPRGETVHTLRAVRVVAVALSVVTFAFFFVHDTFRTDNMFLVPDLVLCAALVVGALVPDRLAVPLLLATFGASAGIFLVSVASYAVRGAVGWASLAGVVIAVSMVGVLTRRTRTLESCPP
jgi:hypothetical protein